MVISTGDTQSMFGSALEGIHLRVENIVFVSALSLVAYFVWRVIYAFWFSPVRHVPGPFWSRVSSVPYRYATFKNSRTAYATEILNKYGPIAVIAPDQIHTNDDHAMKIIYDRSAIKTDFYVNMGSWKGTITTLGKLDYVTAAPTRTNLLQCFQNRNLDTLVNQIDSHVFQFLGILQSKADRDEVVDGVVWFRLLALDIVTEVLWGDQTDLLGHADTAATPDFLRRFHAFSKYNALKSFIPAVEFLVRHFGNSKWKQLRQDCLDMDVTAREALDKWNQRETKGHDRDVLSMLSSMGTGNDAYRIEQADIPAYMVEMMAAGSSTTSHTATFACWALTNHPKCQTKLRTELLEAFPDPTHLDMRTSQTLPYLDAVIRETMRVWPMIPGPLERYLGKPITVNGKTVPPGVIASCGAFDQGRKENVFADADTWNPDRWLQANERMKLNWTPFGYGSRICPGSNLALTELRYMLCAIFRSMKAIQPPGHEHEPIEMVDVFAAGTKSGHCWLKFVRDDKSP